MADWQAIQAEYMAGGKSVNALAHEYKVPEATIRHRAKKGGWIKGAPQKKRQLVAAHMAGVANCVLRNAIRNVEDAAAQDINDLERGLRINRHCLIALEQSAETATEPREVKVIVEAAGQAIDSIRRIRGLADDEGGKRGATDDDDARAAEIEARLASKLAQRSARRTEAGQTPSLGVAPVGA